MSLFRMRRRERRLLPPKTKAEITAAFRRSKDDEVFESILHVIEARAVVYSADAGMEALPAEIAKANARAAFALRDLYGYLQELRDAAGSADDKRTDDLMEEVAEG